MLFTQNFVSISAKSLFLNNGNLNLRKPPFSLWVELSNAIKSLS